MSMFFKIVFTVEIILDLFGDDANGDKAMMTKINQ